MIHCVCWKCGKRVLLKQRGWTKCACGKTYAMNTAHKT